MKKIFIVANWKSNKTILQAEDWLQRLKIEDLRLVNKEIIICPPFTLLSLVSSEVKNRKLRVKVGAQNISQFGEGAYTGEINSRQLKDFADYVIIGHSERRKNFLENDEVLEHKVNLAKANNLISIFCVQSRNTIVPKNADIVLYEPIEAIGTGIPDDPQNANEVAKFIKDNNPVKIVLYGGSVNSKNVSSFSTMPHIDGVGVGTASLNAPEFLEIIKNA